MIKTHFESIDTWIFDLDNTLYPRDCDLFSQIDVKMTEFIMDFLTLPFAEARKIQKDLYRDHGTTLKGLIQNYNIEPKIFLDMVHDIDYSHMPQNPELGALIKTLPGKKYIFTNGDKPHAERTLKQLEIENCFDGIYDIVDAEYLPKPAAKPYEDFIEKFNISSQTAAMFEDMPRNLLVPKDLGMQTVLIVPKDASKWQAEAWEIADDESNFIDHRTNDINDFLKQVV